MKKHFYVVAVGFILSVIALVYSYFIEPHRLVVNKVDIKVKSWNPAFNNLKIAAISDIHGGSNGVTEEKLRQVVQTTNEQNPDVIVLIGDYISEELTDHTKIKMQVATIAENLRGFQAKFGVFVVLGNHDVLYNPEEIAAAFRRVGYQVLETEVALINKDGAKLRILGVKDHMTIISQQGFSDEIRNAVTSREQSGDIIVLEHSPDFMYLIQNGMTNQSDLKLVINGHTHGGQVWLPILGSPFVPSNYGQRYAFGHLKENNVDMFVTTGIGTSILPLRFLVPPEIAILTIRAE